VDRGTGELLPCTDANGGVKGADGCFFPGGGTRGETVPCVCR
jgi:hypothetical protein